MNTMERLIELGERHEELLTTLANLDRQISDVLREWLPSAESTPESVPAELERCA